MAFIVTESCIKCKHTDCVEVCPVDCFYEGPNFLVIHPEECIDCALCEPECPVDAIFSEDELPSDQIEFIEINAELSEIWPNITEEKLIHTFLTDQKPSSCIIKSAVPTKHTKNTKPMKISGEQNKNILDEGLSIILIQISFNI